MSDFGKCDRDDCDADAMVTVSVSLGGVVTTNYTRRACLDHLDHIFATVNSIRMAWEAVMSP